MADASLSEDALLHAFAKPTRHISIHVHCPWQILTQLTKGWKWHHWTYGVMVTTAFLQWHLAKKLDDYRAPGPGARLQSFTPMPSNCLATQKQGHVIITVPLFLRVLNMVHAKNRRPLQGFCFLFEEPSSIFDGICRTLKLWIRSSTHV